LPVSGNIARGQPQIGGGTLGEAFDQRNAGLPGPQIGDLPTKDALTVDASGRVVENTPVTDTSQLDRFLTPENTLINQRIGLDAREIDRGRVDQSFEEALNAIRGGGDKVGQSADLQSLLSSLRGDIDGGLNREDIVRRQFEAQLPFLDEQFAEQSRRLGERTASLGRTGGGFVDRDFADLDLRALRGREGLLGKLTADAAEQEIQDRLGLFNAGTGLTGVQASRDIAGAQTANAFRGQGLNALLGAASLDIQGQEIGVRSDFGRADFLQRERAFERSQARDAMSDRRTELGFQSRGFESNPQGQLNTTAGTILDASGQFGTNAGQIGDTIAANAKARAAAGGGGALPGTSNLGKTQTQSIFGTPSRLQRPGSTLNLGPIKRRPANFGGLAA